MVNKNNGYHVKDLHEASFIACQMNKMPNATRRETKGPIVFQWADSEEVSVQSRMYYSGKEISARDFAQKFREMKELLYKAKEESNKDKNLSVDLDNNIKLKIDNICKDEKIKEKDFVSAAIVEKLDRLNNVKE